jgi:hypothetical protein
MLLNCALLNIGFQHSNVSAMRCYVQPDVRTDTYTAQTGDMQRAWWLSHGDTAPALRVSSAAERLHFARRTSHHIW